MRQNLKRNWLVSSKLTCESWRIFTWALKNVNFLQYNGLLLTKVCNVWAKNVQRRYVWWHWILMQMQHEKFGKFWLEHSKVSKLVLWWDPFTQSRKCFCLKFTGELCIMTMKNDEKFKEELTCQFKINTTNLMNFDSSTWKTQKLAL